MTIHVSAAKNGTGIGPSRKPVPFLDLRRVAVQTREFTLCIEDLRLEHGLRVAVVGPNGCGKTTLIEALVGLRRAQDLHGSMLGQAFQRWIADPRERRRLGIQLQQGVYPGQLTGPELVSLHEAMFGRTSSELAEVLSLAELGQRVYRDFSHGQRQRMNLYMALAHGPEAAFLDEPFTGLDRRTTHGLADHLARRGPASLVVVGHTAPELELSNWFLHLRSGRVVASEPSADALHRICGSGRADIRFADPMQAHAFVAEARLRSFVVRVETRTPLAVTCFGHDGLRDYVLGAANSSRVTDFAFAATTAEDLLRFCSEDKPNA